MPGFTAVLALAKDGCAGVISHEITDLRCREVEALRSTLHVLREPVGLQADLAGEDRIPGFAAVHSALNSSGRRHQANSRRGEDVIEVVVGYLADDLPILTVHGSQKLIISLYHPAVAWINETQMTKRSRIGLRIS